MERLVLLGASGNIGKQALDVLRKKENIALVGFSVGKNTRVISGIIKKHPEVKSVYLIEPKKVKFYSQKYPQIRFFSKKDGFVPFLDSVKHDTVLNALVGFCGLESTIHSLEQNKVVLLANKESLVVGGEIIEKLLKEGQGKLYPIDSEHVAIAKCLNATSKKVDSILITASGGAFRNLSLKETRNLKKEDALKHPTWNMGAKITIDCATMVNKCFEIIEAYYLFGIPFEKIHPILHDKSLVHSMVKFKDGTIRADIGKPDMRKPIKWAITRGQEYSKTKFYHSFEEINEYSFKEFDPSRYPLVAYAETVIKNKNIYGCVLNASNEEAVYAFLKDEIPFYMIDEIINQCMSEITPIETIDYPNLLKTDLLIRKKVRKIVGDFR